MDSEQSVVKEQLVMPVEEKDIYLLTVLEELEMKDRLIDNTTWIKLYRRSCESSVWKNPLVWMVWCWMLMKATHKTYTFPFNGQDMILEPGQFVTGRDKALKEIPTLTTQKYKSIISYLKSTNRITIKTTNKFTVISIQNWNDYQENNQQNNQQITNQQPTNNQQITTYKNGKNGKNGKKITNVIDKFGNPSINELQEYFLKVMDIPKEDVTQRDSRRYWSLLLKESRTGVDGVKWLVDQAKADQFFSNNITSSKDLYYKRIKILARKRGKRPTIAFEGGDNDVENDGGNRILLDK